MQPRQIIRVHALSGQERYVETGFIRRKDGFISSAMGAFLNSMRPALIQAAGVAPDAPIA